MSDNKTLWDVLTDIHDSDETMQFNDIIDELIEENRKEQAVKN